MPRSSHAVRGTPPAVTPSADGAELALVDGAASGDVYTMTEAARLKGVSYHTVSRAVRRGKVPAQRLGRMALISAEDLRAWQPMRERAPRKYRRREPNPEATPALLDLASGERVDLANRLSSLYEVLHGAAAQLSLSDFLSLLADRLAVGLDFKRVAVWGIDAATGRATRLAAYGKPFGTLPAEMALADLPVDWHILEGREAFVVDDLAGIGIPTHGGVLPVKQMFVAPLRVAGDLLGAVVGDCEGDPISLSPAQLGLAQAMTNQAALALERARLRVEEDARANRLAAILENVGEAVFAADAGGHVTVINAAGRDLLGIGDGAVADAEQVADLVGRVRRREFDGRPVAPDDVPLVRAARGETVRDRRHVVVRPDGSERAVSVNAQPIRGADGSLTGAVAVARDITAARAAAAQDAERLVELEAAAARNATVADVALALNAGSGLPTVLRTAISRLTDLLGGQTGAIFLREPDGRMVGRVGYRFPAAEIETLEIPAASLPNTETAFARRTPLFYAYDDAAPSEQVFFDRWNFRAAMIAPLIVNDELIGAAYVNYTAVDRRPSDDETRFAGALAAQCAVAIDKTRLMERMESAHHRLLAVVDQLPQGVVIVEAPHGGVVHVNRAAEQILGVALSETGLAGVALADADGTPFPPGADPLSLTMRSGEARYGETLTVSRPDGSAVTVLANHVPVLDAGGRIVGAVGVLQDIAQLRALDHAKDEFLSVAAHELRNPLTSLHGNLQLLLRRVQKEPERDDEAVRLGAILTQSDRLARLVARLLDVSRAEMGRLDLEPSAADAVALVRRVADGASGLSSVHRLVTETPDRLPVVWDEMRIEQVLANLLGNAVRHAAAGEVRVLLDEPEPGRVRLAVRDQGPGIPETAKGRLFERYYRGGEAAGTGNGLGLGLYISRMIARAHGGDIAVDDAPGGGTVFTVSLPREVAPPAEAAGGRRRVEASATA